MENKTITDRIKKLELSSMILTFAAIAISAFQSIENKLTPLLLLGGVAVAFQPYIFFLHHKIGQFDEYKKKRFWPLVLGLVFIVFLVLKQSFGWELY